MNRLEIADELYRMADKIIGDAIESAPEAVAEPTPEMISENVSGNPNLYIDNPEQYAKMAKYYDPLKEPFGSNEWFRIGWGFGDQRAFKPEMLDGVMVRRTSKQNGQFLGYWIARGYMRVEEDRWYCRMEAYDGVTSEEQALWLATYPNRDLDTRDWFPKYRKMYNG